MKERRKKILSSGTALLCVLAILVSGTLAFLGGAVATNSFKDNIIQITDLTGANLHDDFAGMAGVNTAGVINKDVYVENTGENDVFVRIKLTEVFDKVPQLFMPKLDSTGVITTAGNTPGFEWKLGSNTPKPYNSVKDTAQWNGSLAPGLQTELVGDIFGQATITVGTHANTKDVTTSAGNTLDKDGVISMTQYLAKNAAGREAFVGWIYDADGYAYWSQPLAPNTATGLLLDSVKVPERGTSSYEYDIVVDMEFVDMLDIPAWLDAGADGARQVVTNADKQWNGILTNAEGAEIKAGPNAGATTVEASPNAKQVLAVITDNVQRMGTRSLSAAQTGDGNWIEVATKGSYSLIVKAEAVGVSRYSNTSSAMPYSELDLSNPGNLRYAINEWYNQDMASDARIRSFVVEHDALAKPGTWAYLSAANGFSAPTGATPAAGATDVAFPLSFQEAATYLSIQWYNGFGYTASSKEAIENWQKLESKHNTWLRSVVGADSVSFSGVYGIASSKVNIENSVYPALWVRTAIFD